MTLLASPLTLAENGGSTTVTATQSKLSAVDTIVALGFAGTATQGGDYSPSAAQIVIPAGQLTGTITLTAVQDVLFEADETIVVDIIGVTNGTETGTQQVTATIINGNAAPTVTLAASQLTLAEEGGTITVTATQSILSVLETTVLLTFTGTATQGTNYTLSGLQIVIPAGQLSASITLTAMLDGVYAQDDTVIVDLTISAATLDVRVETSIPSRRSRTECPLRASST